MKLIQKSLISAAVSAAIMAPVAAQAEVTVYGRINQALDLKDVDDGSDSTTDISNVASRFGVKASSNLGNGLTAAAQYEFSTTPDRETDNINDLRVGTVSLSGAFGSVTVGNQWSAFYNNVGTHIDPTYTVGYYLYSDIVDAPYRSSNTIKYANSFGAVNLQLDLRVNDSDDASNAEKIHGDGFGIGINFQPLHNLTVALAYDSESGKSFDSLNAAVDDAMRITAAARTIAEASRPNRTPNLATTDPDEIQANADFAALNAAQTVESRARIALGNEQAQALDDNAERVGVAAKMEFGSYYGILSWHQKTRGDNESSQIQVYGGTNLTDSTSVLIGYGQAELDESVLENFRNESEPTQITLGVYHNVGGGLRLYYEGAMVDYDGTHSKTNERITAPRSDVTRHLVGMRYDF